ncbi:LysR family transcriptional regulator [Caulobacter sp. RL271]|jgi:DNA-binding transcriptional LysR family regulator|uniref:LysR family transcriptional regulator n=1 Tax=Caulobacter segnis TaxID=88688 RepID=A0ABY4ZR67_9CAUL|nr:LysR family transcriptional regulator [Caulobacter segnis]USQ95223.1 LysR family transcriptional regulator [Caulobacter segnis]
MDSLGALNVFVRVTEARSFVGAARRLGVSPSAVGKAIARLEAQLGARLFHRNTRSVALTAEGGLLLDRCRRIFAEIEALTGELSASQEAPRGRLRVSFPLVGMLLMPTLSAFMRTYPEIELDLDFTDRIVDVIEEGFDAVVRTGEVSDSRLMTRSLGAFEHRVVGSPGYFERYGRPTSPEDLMAHACLQHRYPSTGKLERWPLWRDDVFVGGGLSTAVTASTLEPLIYLAEQGHGVTCVPLFSVRAQLAAGTLIPVLEPFLRSAGMFRVVWPTNRQLTPKVRAFVDFLAAELIVGRA